MVITVGSEKQTKIEFKDNVVYVPGIMLKKIYNYRIALPIHFSRIKIAKEFKPDVVHIQNEFAIGATGLRVAKKLNIPAIYTLHTEYDRFLFYVGLKYFEEFSKKISDKYFRKFYKKADVVTSPSPKAQCYMDRQGINKKVVVIDNAVEFENFRETEETKNFRVKFREKYNLNDDAKAFVFVGRIGDEKNIKELINNWIKSDFPEEKAKLFIIGNGPQFEEIQNQIIKNNFENKIILVGSVPNTEISKYLHAMDYYTTASLSEMHSISMLEAMACGLPAIIKLDKPNKDQIKKGINGYQWDSYEDFNKIFNKILSLSSEEAEKLKQNVLKYSMENDHLNQAKILLDIYQKAIEKKRKENK